MNLTSIILKNIKYNIKKYIAYLFGNSFIICILFMFLNLILSKAFMDSPSTSIIKNDLTSIVIIMVAFSVVFILYTTISFTKYRGKEFGVYFTIGLTSKNIMRILAYENIIVSCSAFICGGFFGSLFSKLFYMSIIKILNIDNINIGLNLEAYMYIFIVASLIFIFNTIYQIIFIKRLSISQILKSSSQKYNGNVNSILGIIALSVLTISMIGFKKSIINAQYQDSDKAITISIIAAIISMYFVIGFGMSLLVKISKLFKSFYNSNILVLNALSHRFIAYRAVLYMVTLLVAAAMVFMSVCYSMYKATNSYVNSLYPYDLSFVIPKNKIKGDLRNIITDSGAQIKNYNQLESIDIPDLRKYKNNVKWNNSQIPVVNENNYSELIKKNINIKKGHAIFVYSDESNALLESGLIIDFPKDKNEINKLMQINNEIPFMDYVKSKGNKGFLYIPRKNKIDKLGSISNCLENESCSRSSYIIINDEDYTKLKENSIASYTYYDVMVNINNDNDYKYIKRNLEKRLTKVGGSTVKQTLVLKGEINSRSFELFTFSFLGIMFLIGSAVTLYFKAFTSLNDDKNIVKQLVKIGMTNNEINKVIIKELGAVFIVPPVIAITIVSYCLLTICKFIPEGNYLWSNSIVVFCVYGVIQIIFFILTSIKYLRELG